jgi:hypothetical protein
MQRFHSWSVFATSCHAVAICGPPGSPPAMLSPQGIAIRRLLVTGLYGMLFVGPFGHFWYQGLDTWAEALFSTVSLPFILFKARHTSRQGCAAEIKAAIFRVGFHYGAVIVEMRILILVIKLGPDALFCMPNRANSVLLVSVMALHQARPDRLVQLSVCLTLSLVPRCRLHALRVEGHLSFQRIGVIGVECGRDLWTRPMDAPRRSSSTSAFSGRCTSPSSSLS